VQDCELMDSMLMYEHRHPAKRVEVVDLDPYGTAAPFIDGAVQCVADGGQCSSA
jgi:tRNA (guanine26-N2/guanine27-N2)-dimethyltransferase